MKATTPAQLVQHLQVRGARMTVEGDRLIVDPPPEGLWSGDKELLGRWKPEVVYLLSAPAHTAATVLREHKDVDQADAEVIAAWRNAVFSGDSLLASALVWRAMTDPLLDVLDDPRLEQLRLDGLTHLAAVLADRDDDGYLTGWRTGVAVLLTALSIRAMTATSRV